jgi:hypothetical protein
MRSFTFAAAQPDHARVLMPASDRVPASVHLPKTFISITLDDAARSLREGGHGPVAILGCFRVLLSIVSTTWNNPGTLFLSPCVGWLPSQWCRDDYV